MVDREGKPKQNVVEEPNTPPILAKQIDPVNKTVKSQANNKIVDTPRGNKTDTMKPLYKSICTQRTDTENTVDKLRSVPRSNYSSKVPY